mgnify:CR=1 FL=1|tara:strand:- start:326 stop:1333 length:1008 start_codon:yes stop_codon:yes gene_type:complete
MSKALYLPLNIGYEEEGQEGYTTASEVLDSRNAMEFMNSSLSTIQTFFARMVQLDPEENELFGETGREVNGFRLTTEDEPPGLDHDTAISIRSDHISVLGIQSGKESTSDSLLCMGTWDSTLGKWGVNGALRIDMSDSNAFIMESNQASIKFSQAAKRIDLENTDIFSIADQASKVAPGANHSGLTSINGELYAVDAGGTETIIIPHEVGEWTPTIEQSSSSFDATYVIQRGDYVKIGSLVQATCFIRVSGTSSGSGTVSILGLPFADNEDDYQQVGVIGYNDVFANSCTRAWVNGSKMTIIDGAGTPITPTQSNYSGTVGAGDFSLTVTYTTDS